MNARPGFDQADVIYSDYTGTGTMERTADLRTIAAQLQAQVHLVAVKNSSTKSMVELKSKRESLDGPGSYTYVDALFLFEENGLTTDALTAGRQSLQRTCPETGEPIWAKTSSLHAPHTT